MTVPRATNDGVELYYETVGSGQPVVFVSDLGCGAWLWSWQAPALSGPHETITWDLRGVGRSEEADTYSIGAMADDLDAILADHGVRKAAVVGAGMGGMVALRAALDTSRVGRLALLGTAADGSAFDTRAFLGPPGEMESLTSAAFRDARPEAVERIADWREAEDATKAVCRAQSQAVTAFDVSGRLHEITVPALVAHGTADAVVPFEAGRELAAGLPRGRFEAFEAGSHFVFIEQARLVSDALAGFLGAENGPPDS
ncbi:MAG: alpha/beta fold hydrolase [Halobacteriales archaeon]